MYRLILFIYISIASNLFGQNDTLYFTIVDSINSLKFSAVGDLMCHGTQLNYAEIDSTFFDFKPNFKKVKPIFDESDVVMGNLETVIAGKEFGNLGYPIFNTPIEYLDALKYAGFDLLITANNHATDQGKTGIINTAMNITDTDMQFSGTNTSLEDLDSVNIFTSNDISYAVLSYTYGINLKNLEEEDMYMVNFIDTVRIRQDIKKARQAEADIVILFFHFGKEYAREPSRYQKEIVSKSIQYGADIILGSHPHSLQPVEFFKTNNATLDTGFVAYSLGNFISNQRWRYSDCGVILNFELEKNILSGRVDLKSVDFIPVWVFKGFNGRKNIFEILPSTQYNYSGSLNYLSEEDITLMQQSIEDTRETITGNSNRTKEVIFSSGDRGTDVEGSIIKN